MNGTQRVETSAVGQLANLTSILQESGQDLMSKWLGTNEIECYWMIRVGFIEREETQDLDVFHIRMNHSLDTLVQRKWPSMFRVYQQSSTRNAVWSIGTLHAQYIICKQKSRYIAYGQSPCPGIYVGKPSTTYFSLNAKALLQPCDLRVCNSRMSTICTVIICTEHE